MSLLLPVVSSHTVPPPAPVAFVSVRSPAQITVTSPLLVTMPTRSLPKNPPTSATVPMDRSPVSVSCTAAEAAVLSAAKVSTSLLWVSVMAPLASTPSAPVVIVPLCVTAAPALIRTVPVVPSTVTPAAPIARPSVEPMCRSPPNSEPPCVSRWTVTVSLPPPAPPVLIVSEPVGLMNVTVSLTPLVISEMLLSAVVSSPTTIVSGLLLTNVKTRCVGERLSTIGSRPV